MDTSSRDIEVKSDQDMERNIYITKKSFYDEYKAIRAKARNGEKLTQSEWLILEKGDNYLLG